MGEPEVATRALTRGRQVTGGSRDVAKEADVGVREDGTRSPGCGRLPDLGKARTPTLAGEGLDFSL